MFPQRLATFQFLGSGAFAREPEGFWHTWEFLLTVYSTTWVRTCFRFDFQNRVYYRSLDGRQSLYFGELYDVPHHSGDPRILSHGHDSLVFRVSLKGHS